MNFSTEHTTHFVSPYKALVIGGGGAIGAAFVKAFSTDANCTHLQVISRRFDTGFDLTDEVCVERHATICSANAPYRIIIDATGALSIDGFGPEKSLAGLEFERLTKSFQINAAGPAILLRYFSPLLESGPSIYAKLSARVGSISDNKKGGWYGYRASKAALNMMLQTAAIELQRRNPELRVVALQPGTVKSNLSSPFTASTPCLLEPQESVSGMLRALQYLEPKQGAHFVDYKGNDILW